MLPPITIGRAVSTAVVDPLGLALAVLLSVGYAICLVRVRRQPAAQSQGWPVLRTVSFYLLGVGSLLVVTCGALAAYRGVLFWAGSAQATVLSAVTPIGLALGDPVGLVRRALGERSASRLERVLRGRPARVLMFPLVSSVIAVGTLVVVFFTPYYAASISSLAVREVLYVHLLVTGSLFVLPLLGEEMLPAWCNHPVRALIAFADGLLDAAPGILVMTAPKLLSAGVPSLFSRSWGPAPVMDQRLAGATMLVIAEIVGLPFLGAVFVAWMRADDAEAREFDRAQDLALALAAAGRRGTSPPSGAAVAGASGGERGAGPGTASGGASDDGRERPWWETDPRFGDRYR